MRKLLITNSVELNDSLQRYLQYCGDSNIEISLTFVEMFKISREVLEMDLVIVEAYRIAEGSIDDYGLDVFLNFIRRGKKALLIHSEIQDSGFEVEDVLFKVPGKMKELRDKVERLREKEKIELSEAGVKLLKEWFPYRVTKDHHKRRHEDLNH